MSTPTQRAPKPRALPPRPDEVPYAFAVEVQVGKGDRRMILARCPWCATVHPYVPLSTDAEVVAPCLLGEYVVVIPAGTPMRRVS